MNDSRTTDNAEKQYWRVFYTAARAEKKCRDRLEDRRIDVFLPLRVEIRRWSDRRKKVAVPLFRNYIFARVNEAERLEVLKTKGIVRSVSFGGRPARVSEGEIKQLQLTQEAPDRIEAVDLRPAVGERVAITEGPFRGLVGDVVEHRGTFSVLVRVESIRQAVKVHVPGDWVEAAGDLVVH